MLSVRDVSKNCGKGRRTVPVLQNVSLSVDSGGFCALTGPSGSGKTTLMNLIGLLDRPTDGNIEIGGTAVEHLTVDQTAELRNRVIGFVFQSFHLLTRYTALENVALPLLYRGVSKVERRNMAITALHKVGLADRMTHRPEELSGGQRQRVAIARALVGDPALLLADEPTGNLDSRTADEVFSLFLKLNVEHGLTVIIVTHDPTIAARCPRRVVMRDGQIVDDDSSVPKRVVSA
ncbi:macrolide ABC transporter ATP-binding protein [Rhizobium sp. KAs_5_22]|uniref:ABC transporter ATP-binding protein n=1 Tax=Ciceribacter selenitireducens TaxID=448181 RepID=UPI00056D8264|nr:ABC transporter ATP-binding protein [Ciceribacter selenitireducens]PPJ49472.1 macrolide ABC transporter ATP-binding protein [Rhizobium sp. KAs_5_22]